MIKYTWKIDSISTVAVMIKYTWKINSIEVGTKVEFNFNSFMIEEKANVNIKQMLHNDHVLITDLVKY